MSQPESTFEDDVSSIKTRVFKVNTDSDQAILGNLHSEAAVIEATRRMKHGHVKAMMNWANKNDGRLPWRVKRMPFPGTEGIPVPWLAFFSVVFFMLASGRGLSLEWAAVIFLVALVFLLALGFWLAEHPVDKTGRCAFGDNDPVFSKKPYTVVNAKGKERKITASGLCHYHRFTMDRGSWWRLAEQQIWRGITQNPIKTRTLWRQFGYSFFYIFGYREEFIDPRPIGQGTVYQLRDRKKPDDESFTEMDGLINQLYMVIDELQKMKRSA